MKDGWPPSLLYNANWRPLKDLKARNGPAYASLIGASGKSLRAIRNAVAHEASTSDVDTYRALVPVALWAFEILATQVPSRQALQAKKIRLRNVVIGN